MLYDTILGINHMKQFVKFFNSLDIQKINKDNKDLFQKYLDVYFETHKYSTSRFSKMYIINQNEYYFAIYDDILLYFRLSIYKRKRGGSITLYCAPIDLKKDRKKEKSIIEYLINHGVPVVLSEEDKDIYGYHDKEKIKYLSTFDDFILSSELLTDLKGKDFKHFRWRINQYKKEKDLKIVNDIYTLEPNDYVNESIKITEDWIVRWKELGNRVWENPLAYIKNYNKYATISDDYQFGALFHNNEQIVYEISERMTDTQIISTVGYKTYDNEAIKEANEIILLLGVKKWYERLNNHFLMNLSYCGFLGKLRKQKMKYKPVKILKHYKLYAKDEDKQYIIDNFDKFKYLHMLKTKLTNKRLKSSWKK